MPESPTSERYAELSDSPLMVEVDSPAQPLVVPQDPRPAALELNRKKVTCKRKSTAASTSSSENSIMTAIDRAVNMQETEHELQVKRLRQNISFEEEEHKERMKLLKMQQDFIRQLQNRVNSTASGSNESSYSLFQMYSEMN